MTPEATVTEPDGQSFLGHPTGLAFLVFAESWERFSYYGMQALLVLYMGQQLFLPAHIGHVAGFPPFRAAIESIYGRLSPAALASAIFGLYAGGVYLTPIAGGYLADRVLGRTRTVTIGALLMAAGHFLMAFDASFLPALACLLTGVGCFKGNIASQVGALYGPGDPRRADAFQIYQLCISIAVIFAPLVCGTLAQKVAWHWGFGAAGVGMLIGLAGYLAGRRYLPPEHRVPASPRLARDRLAAGEWRIVMIMVAMLPALALAMLGNQEIFNAYIVWGDSHYDLELFGHGMPVTWLVSLDAFLSAGVLALTIAGWRWWERHYTPVQDMTKLCIGAFVMASAPAVLALASAHAAASGHKIGLAWALPFHILTALGFANLFPVGLSVFSRAAPRPIAGLMIGVFYLHLFLANMLVGYLGGMLEILPGSEFWLLHAGLVGFGGALLVAIRWWAGSLLTPSSSP